MKKVWLDDLDERRKKLMPFTSLLGFDYNVSVKKVGEEIKSVREK